MPSVLIILTGATRWGLKDGRQMPTGFWGEEFVVPHRALVSAGIAVTLATPQGRPAVVDELSLAPQANNGDDAKIANIRDYLEVQRDELAHPSRLEDVDFTAYDAIFVPGGHGPMQDLAVDQRVGEILTATLEDPAKIVAALCHGPAAFFSAGDESRWPFAGRRLTAFSDEEETQVGRAAVAPWLLEQRLRGGGAIVEVGPAWDSHVVVDGNLITGQNPSSAEATVAALLEALEMRGMAA